MKKIIINNSKSFIYNIFLCIFFVIIAFIAQFVCTLLYDLIGDDYLIVLKTMSILYYLFTLFLSYMFGKKILKSTNSLCGNILSTILNVFYQYYHYR